MIEAIGHMFGIFHSWKIT